MYKLIEYLNLEEKKIINKCVLTLKMLKWIVHKKMII